ncbi:transcriptional regulator NrdR [Candidatus Gracilibacteria bacterium]|nr:MAG: transcriptional regulator NrdR [Candidatus Gracilibacteria bacterium]
MKCPKCKSSDTKVVDSRTADDGRSIRRRRECNKCGSRFTTFERLEFVSFMVTKSSGELELYDRDKLEASIMKSLTKRTFDPEKLTDIINSLEMQWAGNKHAITSKRIGRDILKKLREFDEIAFLRYASIYHNHESVSGFIDFLQNELSTS